MNDHEAQEDAQLPKVPGPKVVEKQGVAKERAALRIRSRTVQNKIKAVLVQMTTDAARRTLNSANCSSKVLQ